MPSVWIRIACAFMPPSSVTSGASLALSPTVPMPPATPNPIPPYMNGAAGSRLSRIIRPAVIPFATLASLSSRAVIWATDPAPPTWSLR